MEADTTAKVLGYEHVEHAAKLAIDTIYKEFPFVDGLYVPEQDMRRLIFASLAAAWSKA